MLLTVVGVSLLAASDEPYASELTSQARAHELLTRAQSLHGRLDSVAGFALAFQGSLFPLSQSPSPRPPFRPFPYEETVVFGDDPTRQIIDESFSWPDFVSRYRVVVDGERSFDMNLSSGAVQPPFTDPHERRLQSVLRVPGILMRLALEHPSAVRYIGNRSEGDERLELVRVDVWGERVTLGFDDRLRLRRVARVVDQPMLGDTEEVLEFSGDLKVGDLLLPAHIRIWHGDHLNAELRVRAGKAGAPLEELFSSGSTIRVDESQNNAPPEVLPLSEGVWLVRNVGGGDYQSLLVEGQEGLTVAETPGNTSAMEAVVTVLARRFPDRKITRAILTHHHFDHSGGVRAVLAQGATLFTSADSAEFFRTVGKAPHTIRPDVLTRSKEEWRVEGVAGRMVLPNLGGPRIEIHSLGPTEHSEDSLFVWLPGERVLFQGDLFRKNGDEPEPARPQAIALLRYIEDHGLDVARIVGVHGMEATLDDLRDSVRLAHMD